MQCIIYILYTGFPELEGFDNKWFKENAFYQSRLVSTLDYTEMHVTLPAVSHDSELMQTYAWF